MVVINTTDIDLTIKKPGLNPKQSPTNSATSRTSRECDPRVFEKVVGTFRASSSNLPPKPISLSKLLNILPDLDEVLKTITNDRTSSKWMKWCQYNFPVIVKSCLQPSECEKPWREALSIWKKNDNVDNGIKLFRCALSNLVTLSTRYHLYDTLEKLLQQENPMYGYSGRSSIVDIIKKNTPSFVSNGNLNNIGGNLGGALNSGSNNGVSSIDDGSSELAVSNFGVVVKTFLNEKNSKDFIERCKSLSSIQQKICIVRSLNPPVGFAASFFASLRHAIKETPPRISSYNEIIENMQHLIQLRREDAVQLIGLLARRCILDGDALMVRKHGVKILAEQLKKGVITSGDLEDIVVKHRCLDAVKDRVISKPNSPAAGSKGGSKPPSSRGGRKSDPILLNLSVGCVSGGCLDAVTALFEILTPTAALAEKLVHLLCPLLERETQARQFLVHFMLRRDLPDAALVHLFETLDEVLPDAVFPPLAKCLVTVSDSLTTQASKSSSNPLSAVTSVVTNLLADITIGAEPFSTIPRCKLFGMGRVSSSASVCKAALVFLLRAAWAYELNGVPYDLEVAIRDIFASNHGKGLLPGVVNGWFELMTSVPGVVDCCDFNPPRLLPQVFTFLEQRLVLEPAVDRMLRRSKRIKLLSHWCDKYDLNRVLFDDLKSILAELRIQPQIALGEDESKFESYTKAVLLPRLRLLTICACSSTKFNITSDHIKELYQYLDGPKNDSIIEKTIDELVWQWLLSLCVPPNIYETAFTKLGKDGVTPYKPVYRGLSDDGMIRLLDTVTKMAWTTERGLSMSSYSCALTLFLLSPEQSLCQVFGCEAGFALALEDGSLLSLSDWACADGLSLYCFLLLNLELFSVAN